MKEQPRRGARTSAHLQEMFPECNPHSYCWVAFVCLCLFVFFVVVVFVCLVRGFFGEAGMNQKQHIYC